MRFCLTFPATASCLANEVSSDAAAGGSQRVVGCNTPCSSVQYIVVQIVLVGVSPMNLIRNWNGSLWPRWLLSHDRSSIAGRTEERKLSTLVYVVDGGGIWNEINKSTFII